MTQTSNLQSLTLPVTGLECGGCMRSVDILANPFRLIRNREVANG